MSLLYLSQQITIYGGLILVIIGIFGNSMNILVFSTIRSYRTTPCSFYFLISSIFNIAYVTINLISRIVSTGYGIDLTHTSVIWCKIRQFSLFTLSLITITCSCLATIDQFLVSSQNVKFRRLSNMKWTYRIVFIVIIIWVLHGIPPFLFSNISPVTKTCENINAAYGIYIPIYLLGLICAIPIIIMVLFGYLTYRNIRLTKGLVKQYADRQLVKMTLFQVVLVVISFFPYGIYSTYNLITSGMTKDADRLLQEYFAITILSLVPYFYYSGSCYTFLISSSRFRHAVKDRILFWKRINQVLPLPTVTYGKGTLENKINI
ncbi:unnamed protein product [Adineta steineri]|uniref:G-protein coupled receptors family 1 profile domain-containing protein n=1 Tax=Adineta steineri TaxID=433720 RepID=A0A819QPK9_9BILA|nr:unnamed protein product [Adineta steineri]CAF4028805.1 unnamed protein product [Adineta steineri]